MGCPFDAFQNEIENGDVAYLADMNDWAVRTLRAEGIKRGGVNNMDSTALVMYEIERVRECGDLRSYIKAHRGGAKYRMSRKQRKAVWTLLRTRQRLADLGFVF